MKLWQQVIIGLILGIIAGLYLKEDAVNLKIFGTIFINLVKVDSLQCCFIDVSIIF